MELIYCSNEFPKEDLQTLFRRIRQHAKDKDLLLLSHFISEATRAIKEELSRLPTELKQLFQSFDSVLNWAEDEELREGLLCGAVDGVLLVVAQMAAYIGAVLQGHGPRTSADTSVTGLGIGLLVSSAISLSSTLNDLPLAGADAVRLAFRLGIHVSAKSENLEARDLSERPDTWAYVVHNVDPATAREVLDSIQQQDTIPETGKVFVSAVSRSSITVSGPPQRLKSLFKDSEFFRDARSIALPVYGGLCHAPHVYNLEDVESIVHTDSLYTVGRNARAVMPVYSTSTGIPYASQSASGLFKSIVTELLTCEISWDQVIESIANQSKASEMTSIVLYSFGKSIPLDDLQRTLESTHPEAEAPLNDLLLWTIQTDSMKGTPSTTKHSKLAITGMSCRLPGGATDPEKFWQILAQGLDVSRTIPEDRFDIETHYDPSGKDMNKTMTQYGCFIDEPGLFDAPFFNMSPREAQTVDPQMRLALVTAYEALEQSGFVVDETTQLDRIGTYYGQAADDYREVNQGQEVSTYYIPGGCRAFGPGRINYFFKFSGPSYSIDTACSSGLAAVEVACQALWNGQVDTAVTGGVNVLTNPDGFAGLCSGHFLTKTQNACKTWDATADGYCRADGIVSFVIKRLEDAQAANDSILGVILGADTNHSANAVSITHPHAGHQSFLARKVLRESSVDPLDISYIELHGTGTQAGDKEEMQGVQEVYAPMDKKRRKKDQPLHIGSAKANIGHGESVAGATSLLKTLMMLQKSEIPPHIGITTDINPNLGAKDFDKRNIHIDFQLTPWQRVPGKKRLAAVNSFGAAGGNTTMILEDGPDRIIEEADPRPSHIVAVSAKTKKSLTSNIQRFVDYLDAHPDVNLADLAYTTTARRYQHGYRVVVTTPSTASLKPQFLSRLDTIDSLTQVGKTGNAPPIAFTFTGQGASYKSMNLELYHEVPSFRENIHDLDTLARRQGFPSFVKALDGSFDKDYTGHSPVVTQLALVCFEIALARYWSSLGIKPDVIIGHSLGEFAAMHTAGVLTASDAIFMAGRRAQMLQESCEIGSHKMVAVQASVSQIADALKEEKYTIACINDPSGTVLSGTKQELEKATSLLSAAGYRSISLDVAFAFHSEQTDPILDDYETIMRKAIQFKEPKVPIISPLLGKVIFDEKTLNASYVRRATREAVDFVSALENARKISTISDETIWIEIGPHPVTTGFIKSCIPSTSLAVPSVRRGDNNWKTVSESLAALHTAGVEVSWREFHRPFESRLRVLSDLPSYAFNEKNYWLPYTGDWCLTKGNTFYGSETDIPRARPGLKSAQGSDISTTTVQSLVEESIEGNSGRVVIQSDLMAADFLEAANGHRMNNCGVVTSSIHADIAHTLCTYLYKKFFPRAKNVDMNIANLVVTKGLVANSDKSKPQLIQVTAATSNIHAGFAELTWQNIDQQNNPQDPFATARVYFEDASDWLSSWSPITHLVESRVQALECLAAEGKASRFTRSMAYRLFAANLVDYADKYRGMQSVTMHGLEAFADIELTTKESGTWTIPPFFIDSVAHIAGFVMNCSDSMDVANNYCVTPGWGSMRFAKPLVGGQTYRSYVKMIPTPEDPTTYLGDVYIMQDNQIVGMVGAIQFRSYPRILLSRFFSAPDKSSNATETKSKTSPAPEAQKQAPVTTTAVPPAPQQKAQVLTPPESVPTTPEPTKAKPAVEVITPPLSDEGGPASDTITAKALEIVANEGGLDIADMQDNVGFVDLGVDSLLSLVISEKLKSELDVNVSGSLFLDYPTIGELRSWLDESYS